MGFSGKPELTELPAITNDGFWVNLALADFMRDYRIPAEYDNGVILQGVIMSMVRVNDKLKAVKEAINVLASGSTFSQYLTAHPNYLINGTDWAVLEYKHAVFCHAKAYLLQQFNTLNRRKDAENAAKEAPEVEEYWANQAQQSVYNLLIKYAPNSATTANSDTFVGLI